MCTDVCEIEFFSSAPIHRWNVRSARSDIITVSCDFMKRLFQFFPPFFHWIFDENRHSSPRCLLSHFSLFLSLFILIFFFLYIYILIFIPSRLSLHFFPSIIRVLESEENRWSGVTRNKRRKDLFALERQKNRLCKRILSNAIDFLLHIDSITMTRWWNKDRWTLVFWSEIS